VLSSITLACRRHRSLKGNHQLRRLLHNTNDRASISVVVGETLLQGISHRSTSANNGSERERCLSTHAVRTSSQNLSSQPGHEVPSGIPNQMDFTVESVIENLDKASKFNQGKGGSRRSPKTMWNVDFVRQTVEQYEYCLEHFYQQQQGMDTELLGAPIRNASSPIKKLFLSSETTEHAFRAMLRCKVPTSMLSQKVREWERYIGGLSKTPLTDGLSLRMLEANGKAGNIGRAITLLSVRKSRGYPPEKAEFVYAITAIEAAGLYFRNKRNVFLPDKDQPQIDDPTRWLDAILLNMNQRDFPLTTPLANRMLNTHASTGKSGKALHYFYRVLRTPLEKDDDDVDDVEDSLLEGNSKSGMAHFRNRPVKVRLSMRPPPPYHKIPSQVRGKLVRKPGSEVKQLKLDRESDPDWSPPLTAAISFADSLTQGACGHDPIELDLISYSILIKACVNRGSLWRAMHILDEVMPSHGVEPDVVAYNTLFTGLSKVGDVPTIREYFDQMLSKEIEPTKETIEAIVNGLLNLGDVATAITVVQDYFNQHSILPPYTTHLKILEFALGRGFVFEAKRHVYFIQQLWKWKSNDYHSKDFSRVMELTKNNPKLSEEALKKLFAYFGETLDDSDFF
jgi:pentatricopeptide repeat protein